MHEAKRWSVTIHIDEHEGRTRARAQVHTRDGAGPVAVGTARLDPAEHDVPEIGEELAVARALTELGKGLLEAAAADVDDVAGR
jgi:hypothetical protein